MLTPILMMSFVVSVYSYIPPSNVCYQHREIRSACDYGNLTVAVLGKTYKSKDGDCNRRIDNQELEQAPTIYINSTNTTERFTVMMLDLGYQGRGGMFLQWMVTNVSINTLPNWKRIPPNDLIAGYQQPLLMVGQPQPHLVQILVFRHFNVLRVPFGELWITKRQDFKFSNLFSNTHPNLQLCGPVAGIQFWVHDDHQPSAPLAPPGTNYIPPPGTNYIPPPGTNYIPPPGTNYVPPPPQTGGYYPPPGHDSHNQHVGTGNGQKKSLAATVKPMKYLLVLLVLYAIMVL